MSSENLNLKVAARSATVVRDNAGNVTSISNNNYGQVTAFDQTQYKVGTLMYPNDLMAEENNQYGGNFVAFYINVHEESFLYKNKVDGAFVEGGIPPRMAGEVRGENVNAATLTTIGTMASVTAANAGDITGRVTRLAGVDLPDTVKAVSNTTIGAVGAGLAIGAIGNLTADYKRMAEVITLYVPNEMSIKYTAGYDTDATSTTMAMATVGEGLFNAVKNLSHLKDLSLTESGDALTQGMGAGANWWAGMALKTPGIGGVIQRTAGITANPKKEQLFTEVDFRTFQFSYQFLPRSEEEAAKVEQIIKTFKLHMHPEYKDSSHFLYIFPSEFDIYYYQNGQENMHLHRHTSCVLTDMNVIYSPQGQFATFSNGMPSQINVTLSFKELALLTKESIQDGY